MDNNMQLYTPVFTSGYVVAIDYLANCCTLPTPAINLNYMMINTM